MILLANDETASIVMVLVLVVFFGLAVFAIGSGVTSHRNARLREFARAYGGEVEPAGWFSLPRMHFRHGDRLVSLYYSYGGGKHKKYKTRRPVYSDVMRRKACGGRLRRGDPA